jgi:hypothetical protein
MRRAAVRFHLSIEKKKTGAEVKVEWIEAAGLRGERRHRSGSMAAGRRTSKR